MVGGFVIIPSIIAFYSSYFLLFHLYVRKKIGSLKLTVSIILTILISCFIALVNVQFWLRSLSVLLEVGVVSLFLNAFNVLIGFILRSFTSWFTDIKEKEELGKKTELLELEMIKLKLDPHFLFNTINNIDVLIETDPEKASEYVFKLSSILRFYLYKASDSVINLSDELKYIHEYVELQKIRTSNLEFVNLTINGDPANKKIAPMVFIPFIENAFKHSLDKKTNAIVINIEILHDVVHFQCKNKKNLFIDEHSEAKGLGDSLIKNRLKLIYGDNYHINVNDSEKEYLVDLKIPV